jgi:hypothetical protein
VKWRKGAKKGQKKGRKRELKTGTPFSHVDIEKGKTRRKTDVNTKKKKREKREQKKLLL